MSNTSPIVPVGTTKIDVNLKNPNGWPMTHTRFIIKPIRAGFQAGSLGLVEDKEELYSTDENGYVQMHLMPLPFPYILTYSYDDESIPGHFVFYVPQTTDVVTLESLIVTQTMPVPNYPEDVLAQIVAAAASVSVFAGQAAASAASAESAAAAARFAANTATQKASQTDEDREVVAATEAGLQHNLQQMTEAIVKIQGINLQNKLLLGGYQIWVDAQGKLRIKDGAPTSDTDGTVVGDQTS